MLFMWLSYLTTFLFNHSCSQKAIESAISSHQWHKAIQIIEIQEPSTGEKYYPKIAKHYATVRNFEVSCLSV